MVAGASPLSSSSLYPEPENLERGMQGRKPRFTKDLPPRSSDAPQHFNESRGSHFSILASEERWIQEQLLGRNLKAVPRRARI